MKRTLLVLALVTLLSGCIESQLALVPDSDALLVDGVEGQWILESEPQTILCAKAVAGSSLYALTNSDDPGEVVTLAFLPLIPGHFLLRWDERKTDGVETLYAIVRQDPDALFGLMIAEGKDVVQEVAAQVGYPAANLEMTEYSMILSHPDREMQLALLKAVAQRSADIPGLRYVKVGEPPCPEPAPGPEQ